MEKNNLSIEELAKLIARRDAITTGLPMWEAQYMQHTELYARQLNELYDLELKLKEVGI